MCRPAFLTVYLYGGELLCNLTKLTAASDPLLRMEYIDFRIAFARWWGLHMAAGAVERKARPSLQTVKRSDIMSSFETSYNLSLEDSFVSMQTDIKNLFDCYMDLMRAFASGAGNSQTIQISSDFVIWYETYRNRYGQAFIDAMQAGILRNLTDALQISIGWAKGQMPEDSKTARATIAVATGTLAILRAFEASGMDFEELSGPMKLWAELRALHGSE